MFCPECGTSIKDDTQFCPSCGVKIERGSLENEIVAKYPETLFYSKDWARAKTFELTSIPYFDIIITKDNLYLIKYPSMHSGTLGFVLGLVLFRIIGAIVGTAIGNGADRKKRQKYRSKWVDKDGKFISQDYDKYIFLKIPINEVKNRLLFKKNKYAIFSDGDKKTTLRKTKKELEQLSAHLKSINAITF